MIPSEGTKILEFNQCHKSDQAPFIIYADLESLIQLVVTINKLNQNFVLTI